MSNVRAGERSAATHPPTASPPVRDSVSHAQRRLGADGPLGPGEEER